MATTVNMTDESVNSRESLTVHWRAVFAGIFIAMLVYFTLMSLGVAIGAGEVKDVLQGADAGQGLGTGVGVWMLLTVLISLFVGSYASGRVSGIIATRVGYMQGAVVSALFFTLMVTQAGIALGLISSGLGSLKNAISGTASSLASNPQITSVVEDSLTDLKLRSNVEQVVPGLLTRFMRGDRESAINYLASQAGISREEAQSRYESLTARIRSTANVLGQRTADAARAMGGLAFGLMLFGTIFGMVGGGLGAQLNLRKPIDNLDRKAMRMHQQAYT